MLNDLPNYPFIIIGALVAVLGAFSVQRYVAHGSARQRFRERFIELVGFYPPPGDWSMGFEKKLAEQLQELDAEVNKFLFHVPRRQRSKFEGERTVFLHEARSMTWDGCAGYAMYPSMRKPGDCDPKAVFYKHLDRLFGYAKET